ncbi:MAG TPA: hypothetical protein VGB13_01975 [Candidatus Krumholzibacteria bacterium]|jgi:hypothetical protein
MPTILAVAVNPKVLPQLLSLRDKIRGAADVRWLADDALCVRLGELDATAVDRRNDAVRSAMDKAANAHQGFNVELRRVSVDTLHGGGHGVVLNVYRKAGMLQSLANSFVDRAPSDVRMRYVDPWRPQLVLAECSGPADEATCLALESAAHGLELTMGVKTLQLLDGKTVLHEATLPSSGG